MKDSKTRFKKRLLNVARALRESDAPEYFSMFNYTSLCGTPQCALGHYASRHDLQHTFRIGDGGYLYKAGTSCRTPFDGNTVANHFYITESEAFDLFSMVGCNEAKTVEDAAKYIENFVAARSYRYG